MRWCLTIRIVALTCAVRLAAYAEESVDKERSMARTLGQKGVDAYKQGDYATAEEKLERAYGILKAPTLALWWARALRQQSKLIESARKYLEATRLDVTTGKVDVQRRAQEQAAGERTEVLVQIPSVTFAIEGAPAEEVELEVDNVLLPKAALSGSWQVNPGRHRTKARAKGKLAIVETELARGEQRVIRLQLRPESPLRLPPPAGIMSTGKSVAQSGRASAYRKANEPVTRSLTWKTAGWVSLGVGGASLAFSGVVGMVALTKFKTLNERCSNQECSRTEQHLLQDYRSLRMLSRLGFVVGTVGVTTGGWLFFVAPKAKLEPLPVAKASIWFNLGQAGLDGVF